MSQPIPLNTVAIIVHPTDNVAVAKQDITSGTTLVVDDHIVTLNAAINAGHRFALVDIPAGEYTRQYGQPFARSLGLRAGDAVTAEMTENVSPHLDPETLDLLPPQLAPWEGDLPTFNGFHRPDGQVGVRNWVLIVPTSMCSSLEASQISARAELGGIYQRELYPNVDGVTAIPHTGGCGCPNPLAGAPQRGTLYNTFHILAQYIRHPNVAAAIIIELGCEKTNFEAFDDYYELDGAATWFGKPVRRISIQNDGGSVATVEKGVAMLPELLAYANGIERKPAPLSKLSIGLECGGSDAFSGLSANPALGIASDLLVRAGGRSVIAEVPEFYGAEHLFAARAANRQIARDVYALLDQYRANAEKTGHGMEDNPSRGNKDGGLLNITIKSLGAQAKSGSGPVQGVMQYGDWVWEHSESGVYMLNTPGYDPPSVTGLVGAGCQIVCFTTGRGSVFGNAIAPVVKIATNNTLFNKMQYDMDVNTGTVIDGSQTLEQAGEAIFKAVLDAASGKWTHSETNGHREFMLWNIDGLWL